MDNYDFRKIDLRVLSRLEDFNSQITNQKPPSKTELISIGEYNGVDIPGVQVGGIYDSESAKSAFITEADYTVWIEMANPEYDCEVIIS